LYLERPIGNPSVPVLRNGSKENSLKNFQTRMGKADGEWDFIVNFDRVLM
jgi:hypothetical protein